MRTLSDFLVRKGLGDMSSTQWYCLLEEATGHVFQNSKGTQRGVNVEKLEPSFMAGGNVKWGSRCGEESGRSSKGKT